LVDGNGASKYGSEYMIDYPMVRVKHIPLHPPRKSTPGEGIYLELWKEWATSRPNDWLAIFETNGPVRQRAASVAASFMVFMGCNGGRCFTLTAQRFADQQMFWHLRSHAYLAAWALENQRSHGVNSGLRTSEYMLAQEHPISKGVMGGRVVRSLVPAITQEDNDILESMVRWWSSTTAQAMRSVAEPMIEAANAKLRSGIFQYQGDSS
jgi:hypothetical protein